MGKQSLMKNTKNKVQLFIRGSFFLIISNICIKAINFFLLPLYTKNLTPSMLGVSDSITTFTGILFPLLVMGLDSAYSAFYFDKLDLDRDKKVFSTLGITFFLLGGIPLLLCFVSTPISYAIFKTASYNIEVMIALVGVTLNLWYLPFSLELRLKNQMGRFGMVSIIASFSMILLQILFVTVLKLGEMSLILSTTIVALEQLLCYGGFTCKVPRKKYFDAACLQKMLKFAFPLIPSVLMAWVLSLSDRYILLYYYGDTSVGIYGIGSRLVTLLNVVINAITTAYTTFAFSSKDDDDAKQKYYSIFNVVSLMLITIAFTISIFSKEIIYIMTDEAYRPAYAIIRDMMYGQVFYAMSTILSYGIVFNKKSVYSLIAVSSGAIVNFILNLIFIPHYGLEAAAMTTLIGYFICMVVSYYFSERLYPCEYGIKRVMITCFISYMVSLLGKEALWTVKALIWTVTCIGIIVFYKDFLKIIITFIKSLLRSKNGGEGSN